MSTSPSGAGSQASLRERNTAALSAALSARGPQLQAELATLTGLSRATVSNIVGQEVEAGRFRVERVLRDGRWGVLVSLVPEGWVVFGVDVGRTHVRLVGWDTARHEIGGRAEPLAPGHSPESTLTLVARLLDDVVADAGMGRSAVRRVGLSLPASIGPDGEVVQGSVLREWSGRDLHRLAVEALGVDVVIENDANLGALAHAQHASARGGTLVYVKIASGIGAGIVTGDQVYRSTSGLTGEIGHVQVVDGGQTCYCGSRGCLETLASVRTIVADYGHARGREATVDDLVAAVLANDRVAVRILEEAGDALGRVLASVCNLLGPDAVVLGGPLAPVGEPLLAAVVASVRKRALPSAIGGVEFSMSHLEPRAEVQGACLLALAPGGVV
ncbi:ROK family transcriptional regulator [Xylanimonas ulmi]|uniref:Putative NBD/HSP70 family sugar kinase n=1 Tax=Xylanimonas ulmi TaxID=228973 RepID=A0A4Q7M9I3_9MICO|nr:ROK family transcriptional regulator [Xylanibacterium ulmi]RZS62879.1 putative NBD/HSP70 family sugar kinase [Xylanibacterium ulmi]